MTTQGLYQKILNNLNDSEIPAQVRLADRKTQERIARRLAELLQPTVIKRQSSQVSFIATSASKYDD